MKRWRNCSLVSLKCCWEGKGNSGCVCGLGSHGTWMCLSRQHLLMTEKSENIKNTPVLITATGVAAGKEMEQVEAK